MDRRGFLSLTAAAAAGLLRSREIPIHLQSSTPDAARTFEITTHVHVQRASGGTRVWLPTPLAVAPYQSTLGDTYHVDEGSVSMVEREGLDFLAAEWPDGAEPIVTLTSRVATKPRTVDLSSPTVPPPKDFSAFSGWLRPPASALLDEQSVKERVAAAGGGAGTDLDRARAMYESIAGDRDGRIHNPHTLFVAVARAGGIPARFVNGLALASPEASRAQASRVEVYLVGFGWVPVDLRSKQFGAWDAAWVAFNSAEDVVLPGATHGKLPDFMHPQAETGGRRVDSLDPDGFRYSISVQAG